MKYIYKIFVLISLFSNPVVAQEISDLDLKSAIGYYEEGRFDNAIQQLINKDFKSSDKENKSIAYKYLAAAYYAIDELETADSLMVEFLKLNPLYKENKNTDPAEFTRRMKRFKIYPKLALTLKLGVNKTSVAISQKNTLSQSAVYNKPYISNPGLNIYIGLEQRLFNNLYLDFGTGLQTMGYTRTIEYTNRPSAVNFQFNEDLSRAEVSIGLSYKVFIQNFVITAGAGTGALYSRSVVKTNYAAANPIQNEEKIYLLKNRIDYNARNYANARVGYQIGNIEYFADFTYKTDLLSPVINIYYPEWYYPMFYVDDIFYLKNMQFTAGINLRIRYKVKNRYE